LKHRVETWCYEAGLALGGGNWGPKADPECDVAQRRALQWAGDDTARSKAIFYICCAKSDNQGDAPAKVPPPATATPTIEQVKAVGDMKEKEGDSSCK